MRVRIGMHMFVDVTDGVTGIHKPGNAVKLPYQVLIQDQQNVVTLHKKLVER